MFDSVKPFLKRMLKYEADSADNLETLIAEHFPFNHSSQIVGDACGIIDQEFLNGDFQIPVEETFSESVESVESMFSKRELAFLVVQFCVNGSEKEDSMADLFLDLMLFSHFRSENKEL